MSDTISVTIAAPEVAVTVLEPDEIGVSIANVSVAVVGVSEAGPRGPAGATGATGPAGATGPQGPPGPGTSGGGSYRHVQSSPASTWTIAHNLGFFPNVSAFDSGGAEVFGDISHIDVNNLIVAFTSAGAPSSFSGEAYAS